MTENVVLFEQVIVAGIDEVADFFEVGSAFTALVRTEPVENQTDLLAEGQSGNIDFFFRMTGWIELPLSLEYERQGCCSLIPKRDLNRSSRGILAQTYTRVNRDLLSPQRDGQLVNNCSDRDIP